MEEKYGFVYIWYDKKRSMFYIGSHWGSEDDGYICSSNRMRNAYRRRPKDFKRRLIEKTEDRSKLLTLEENWLKMAEKNKNKHYNVCFTTKSPWWENEDTRLSVGQKISKKNKANPNFGKWNCGRTLSEETKKKISKSTSIAMKEHYKENPRTPETCKKISENNKRLQREKKIGMHGKKHKPETIEKMKQNNAMKNPIHVNKIIEAKKGIKYLNKNGKRKMAVPNTEKWNVLIEQGYNEGY